MGSFRTKTITSTTYGSGSVDIVGAGGSATGTYSGSATTTTTMPDEAARAQSAAQIAAIEQRKEAAMQAVHDITLRSNTLFPGQQISGAIFFEREKNHTSMVLSVPLAGRTFQFVFLNAILRRRHLPMYVLIAHFGAFVFEFATFPKSTTDSLQLPRLGLQNPRN
jgi:hypothetical protein